MRVARWRRRRYWADPVRKLAAEACWSLAIAFRKRDGSYCELRAEILDISVPESLDLTRLTRLLKEFGTRFGEELDAQSPLLRNDGEETGASWDQRIRRRAA